MEPSGPDKVKSSHKGVKDSLENSYSVEGLFEYINETVLALLRDNVERLPKGRQKSVVVMTRIKSMKGDDIRFRSQVELTKVADSDESTGEEEASRGYVKSFKDWMKQEKENRLKDFRKVVEPLFRISTNDRTLEENGAGETTEGKLKDVNAKSLKVDDFADIEIYLEGEGSSSEQNIQKRSKIPDLEEKKPQRASNSIDGSAMLEALFGSETDSENENFEFEFDQLKGPKGVKVVPTSINQEKSKGISQQNSPKTRESMKRTSVKRAPSKRESATRTGNKVVLPLKPMQHSKKGPREVAVSFEENFGSDKEMPRIITSVKLDSPTKLLTSETTSKVETVIQTKTKVKSQNSDLPPPLQLVAQDAAVVYPAAARPKIGAGIKRRIRLKKDNKKKRKKNKKNENLVRSKNMGPHLQPLYIAMYFVFPLALLAIEYLIPYLEMLWHFLTDPNNTYRYEHDERQIPFIIRLIFERLLSEYPNLLDKGVRIGAAFIRLGGLFVLGNALYRWIVFFNLLRPRPVVRFKTQIKSSQDDEFAYLFKWHRDEYSDSSDSE